MTALRDTHGEGRHAEAMSSDPRHYKNPTIAGFFVLLSRGGSPDNTLRRSLEGMALEMAE